MLLSTLFSLSADLSLVDVRLEDEGLTLVLRSSQTNAMCPECAQPSTHVHGHYTRRLADLPCQKRPVRVCLEVCRFACRTRGCPRTTFAERFPLLTRAYARRTLRQAEALTEIAFAQGGKAGAQLAKRLAMPAGRDTRLAAHPRLCAPEAQDPAGAGTRRFRLEKRRPLRHAAGRFASPLSGRGPAGSGSRHRRPRASCASGREDYQSGSCWGVCRGSHTWRSACQASRLLATMCRSTCATRSKTRWHVTKACCHRWKERRKCRSPPPSNRPSCRKSQPCLWTHPSSTSEQRACKTMGHVPGSRIRLRLLRGVGRSAGPIASPADRADCDFASRGTREGARLLGSCTSAARWSIARCVLEPFRSARPLAGARASSHRSFPTCTSAGKRAVTTASNWRANSKPKDFADPPRWFVVSLAHGEYACLGRRSECAARNDRRLHPPSAVCHPDRRPGCSSQTSSSLRQTSGRSLSASARPMPPSRNSISWDKTLCRWSSNGKRGDWTHGWPGLTRAPRWNCGDLLLASSEITPPFKQRCLFRGGEAAGGGTDHTPETAETANVRAGSLRSPSLARPLHRLIQPPHRVRMSHKRSPYDTLSGTML